MTGEPITVVVVDDEPDVRLLLRIQLAHVEGFEVVGEAGDGAEAVERCLELRPRAVVMDLLMPGVNGFEAIERIRRSAPAVAIVAYTAVAGEFVRTEMARLGVRVVLKSGSSTALVEALRRAVDEVASGGDLAGA